MARLLAALGLALVALLTASAGAPASIVLAAAALPPLVILLRATSRLPVAVLRGPLLVLVLVAMPMSLWASAWPVAISMPRVATLAWSLVLALWVAQGTSRTAWPPLAAIMGVALAVFPGLPPNERAGAVAPLAVLILACCWSLPPRGFAPAAWRGTWSSFSWLMLAISLVVTLVTLVATGSRGGLLALVVGLGTTALLGVPTPGRRPRLLAVVGLLLVTVVLLRRAGGDLVARLLFDGSPQGWSWDVVLTGRPRIWDRAIEMLADGGLTGVGLGMFGAVAHEVYALPLGSGPLEDAHSLPLQVMLDFGWVGALAWWCIIGLTVRQAWRALWANERGQPARWRAAGLCGAIVATATFNLADAIAPGTIAGLGSWLLVGAVFGQAVDLRGAATGIERPSTEPTEAKAGWYGILLVASVGALLVGSVPAVRHAWHLDLLSRDAVRAVLRQDQAGLRDAHTRLTALIRRAPALCRGHWLAGRVLATLGDAGAARRDDAWLQLAICDPSRVDLVAAAAPDSRRLAREIVAVRPELARAHLWLARSYGRRPAGGDRVAAIRSFRRGLALDPRDGLAWRQLGDLLVERDPRAALAAYAGSCRHGDPGANGCLLAGATARYLGDTDKAIVYYRASRWPPVRARAAALERLQRRKSL